MHPSRNDTDPPQLPEHELLAALEKRYGISLAEFSSFLARRDSIQEGIPVVILRTQGLSSLEAIVKFLREHRHMDYGAMGASLKRRPHSLAATYSIAKKKSPAPFPAAIDSDADRVPFHAFDSGLSVLESIVVYLKTQGKTHAQIARLLNKDPRTVWTVCKRAEKKGTATSSGSSDARATSAAPNRGDAT